MLNTILVYMRKFLIHSMTYPYGSALSFTDELLKYRKAQGCHSKMQSPHSVTQLSSSRASASARCLVAWGFVARGSEAGKGGA